eukprot:TRINITY_DN7179_c0_g1_i1.p1 TRINITY_DN7179_c0_g1~~TRINITY_DN7179_c0_g1_i1.p1  ORF type:complete len:736 (-),score=146.58 TRINITY_DN7179_c0_g1_i1:401-2608(-)
MGIVKLLSRRISQAQQGFNVLQRRSISDSKNNVAAIEKILIANRGEIACRVIRTARNLGIQTVAVFSDADKGALHVEQADEAVCIGPALARSSYLNTSSIIQAAVRTQAHAIHPGYGFLSESAEFAELCRGEGLIFIGPPPSAIRDMGDKSASKKIMSKAGVPIIPGYHGEQQEIAFLKEEADRIGYPILIKPTRGGGGKGMRIVHSPNEFVEALLGAQREAASSFGNETVLLEKYISCPRHIEVQIFGDKHGGVVHLYERDCSLQRRHQKIIEESPAPNITDETRHHLGQAAVSAAKAVGYHNAGTVEFIMDTLSGEFYFLEMNTRLQVEHPVTEMVIGQDLVEWQIRVANGEALPLNQSQISQSGHAFEARIYAENVPKGFLPAVGCLHHYRQPSLSSKVRVETGVKEGDTVSVHYDPMIAKLVVWGENRTAALVKLRDCLSQFQIGGLPNNILFLQDLASHPSFSSGQVETNFIEKFKDELFHDLNKIGIFEAELERAKFGAALAAVCICLRENIQSDNPSKDGYASLWYTTPVFRVNHAAKRVINLKWKSETGDITSKPLSVIVTYQMDGTHSVQIEDYSIPRINIQGGTMSDGQDIKLEVNGILMKASLGTYIKDSIEHVHIWHSRQHHHFTHNIHMSGYDDEETESKTRLVTDIKRSKGSVIAPMAGCIVKILVKDGELVQKGQAILVLEAMKMEHVVQAPCEGHIQKLNVVTGQQVFDDSLLFVVEEK